MDGMLFHPSVRPTRPSQRTTFKKDSSLFPSRRATTGGYSLSCPAGGAFFSPSSFVGGESPLRSERDLLLQSRGSVDLVPSCGVWGHGACWARRERGTGDGRPPCNHDPPGGHVLVYACLPWRNTVQHGRIRLWGPADGSCYARHAMGSFSLLGCAGHARWRSSACCWGVALCLCHV